MFKLNCLILFCALIINYVNCDNTVDQDLYCTDPQTNLRYPVNSTWPSTTFCGTYTCHVIVEDAESGNSKKIPKIVPNINKDNEKVEITVDDKEDTDIYEDGSGEFNSDVEKENTRRQQEISDWEENEFGKLYELYKIASDLNESIKKAKSELKREDGIPKKSANQIKDEITSNKDYVGGNDDRAKENHKNEIQYQTKIHNNKITSDVYKDYDSYLRQYYAQYYPHYYQNYQSESATNQDNDASTSPSEIYGSYYPCYEHNNGYYYEYNPYVTQKANESRVIYNYNYDNQNIYSTPSVDESKNSFEHQPKRYDHQPAEPNNYEKEYHSFYHEYMSKYPKTTVYSSNPKTEDVKHFYSLYYERFPYKRPKTAEEQYHNHDDVAKQENVVQYEKPENTRDWQTNKPVVNDDDKEAVLEELQNWADYRHSKDTIRWQPNPFETTEDKDVYLTGGKHSGIDINSGKYDWINSKLGQFGISSPVKPNRSYNLNPLLSAARRQLRLEDVLKKLSSASGLHLPHHRGTRSAQMKTFMTVKGCPEHFKPGIFKNGDPYKSYPQCCPQKITY